MHQHVISQSKQKICLIMFTTILIIGLSFVRFKIGEINYLNSDATWHVLYTLQCYEETPVSVHKFLPIVSLGGENNKWISWGSTIPDLNGNYYYTSFSPAGYVVPYAFFRLFNLGYTERGLYIFNTCLFLISAIILALFLMDIFREYSKNCLIAGTGVIIYSMEPELLHGMGIVYWHQSLLQITLLLQFYAYYRYREYKSKKAYLGFLLLCFINPYVEWTGYVANIGFAVAELISKRKNIYEAMIKSGIVGGLTTCSFITFCCHYLLNVDIESFLFALKKRFLARNFLSVTTSIGDLFYGYLKSFQFAWMLLVILIIILLLLLILKRLYTKKIIKTLLKYKYLMFVMIFPILENFLMKQHAVYYTYDRMKLIFPIVLLSCSMIAIFSVYLDIKKFYTLIVLILLCGCLNVHQYTSDTFYCWEVNYRGSNLRLAEYISPYKENAVIGYSKNVRGYLNMLLHSGIYENKPFYAVKNIAVNHKKRYAITVINELNSLSRWNMYDLASLIVFDSVSGKCIKTYVDGGNIKSSKGYILADLTDKNWTNGYSNKGNTILFDYNNALLAELHKSNYIVCDNIKHQILNIDSTNKWIRIAVNDSAKDCMYPAVVTLE